MVTSDSPSVPEQPASETGGPPQPEQAGGTAAHMPGTRHVRRVTAWGKRKAEWGQQKYAGSSAEYLQRRLTGLDFINQGMLFAATLLLCAIPFLTVVAALAGKSSASTIGRRMGLDPQASAVFGHLFASPSATQAAVVGTTSMVFFVLGGIAVASTLQVLYERVFDVSPRGVKGLPRQLIWLAVLLGLGFVAGGPVGPAVRHAGPVVFGAVALIYFIGFWWFTLWLLLAGRVSWRRLFPCACATGLFWLGMEAVFSLFISGMVISDNKEYGPIGIISALMAYLIAIGVVIVLGAVVGLVWQERNLSFRAAFSKVRRAR
jgi:membrane protein